MKRWPLFTLLSLAAAGKAEQLHGLFLRSSRKDAPVLLHLHRARWNVSGSSGRMRRMQEIGFSVLAVDYRGFGRSSTGLQSETTALEDARAAWDWIARRHPTQPRYIFGHSLGGAIAIDLAVQVDDERGTIVEGMRGSWRQMILTLVKPGKTRPCPLRWPPLAWMNTI